MRVLFIENWLPADYVEIKRFCWCAAFLYRELLLSYEREKTFVESNMCLYAYLVCVSIFGNKSRSDYFDLLLSMGSSLVCECVY